MSCVLCDSWAHCPVNPKSLHPRKRTEVVEQDVEVALLTGFVWGTVKAEELCDKHREAVSSMKTHLGI